MDESAQARAALDCLLQGSLEALDPAAGPADAGLLHELLQESAQMARLAGLSGSAVLLDVWAGALGRAAQRGHSPGAREATAIAAWLADLQAHCCKAQADAWRSLLPRLAKMTRGTALTPAREAEVAGWLEAEAAGCREQQEDGIGDPQLGSREAAFPPPPLAGEGCGEGGPSSPQDISTLSPTLLRPPAHEHSSWALRGAQADACERAAPPRQQERGNEASLLVDGVADPASMPSPESRVPSPDTPIWISPEELQLALDAVATQVLPGIYALADAPEGGRVELEAELAYQMGLVGNALEMLGTPQLAGLIGQVGEGVAAGTAAPEALVGWSAALIGWCEQPGAGTARELAAQCSGLAPVDIDALAAEAARVRIGMDPAAVAQRKRRVEAGDTALQPAADVLPNVLEGMLRELPGNAARLGDALRRLVARGEAQAADEARRAAHTLKGDANTVGIRGLANLTHALEDLLVDLSREPGVPPKALGEKLERAADCVEEIADHLLGRGHAPTQLASVYQAVLDAVNDPHARAAHADEAAPEPAANQDLEAPPEPGAEAPRVPTLNVASALLDELQRLSGETLVMARQIDQRLQLIETMHREQSGDSRLAGNLLDKLDDLVSLRGAALQSAAMRTGSSVDPLEMDQYTELHVVARRLIEAHADQQEQQRRLDSLLVDLESLRSQQEAIHADLQRASQRARTVPFEQVAGRLQRIVRQTSRQLERPTELSIRGADTLVDADLLERIVEPLGHLLRNAIDHGIEDVAERLLAGKSPTGHIAVSLRTVSDSIEILVEDDGRGLDYAAIRARALANGLIDPEAEADTAELARLVLLPGFTTRREITQVSGRGIGMDVVNQRITEVRGNLALSGTPGHGLRVRIRVPVSQTMAHVIVAHGHGMVVAAVASSVEQVLSFTPEDLAYADDGQLRLRHGTDSIPVCPIETLYGRGDGPLSLSERSGLGLLVRDRRDRPLLVAVSGIDVVSQVIVKPVSVHLPPIPAVRGVTQLGDGRLAAVIDMGTLVDALEGEARGLRLADLPEPPRLPRVVVADDSLSVRRALSQLLQDAGFEVACARDGLEALELINAQTPALVLLDLEMPRLNGLEVTRFMRNSATRTPVLMISSRASERYRGQAEEAGVDMMLGKPVSEDELLGAVRELMTRAAIPAIA